MAENQQMSTEKRQKNAKKFYCEKCDFGCNRFAEYKRHIDTRKHKSTENQQEKHQKHQTIILSIWRKKGINFTAKYFRDLKIGHF